MADGAFQSTPKLSAVIIVWNEEHCLERCLRSIAPIVDEIIVIDSGSTDRTVSIARSFGAKVEIADWPGFGRQKNRALSQARGEWVLAIDADEYVTPRLADSISAVVASPQDDVCGYYIRFLATWCGRPVRFGSWANKQHLRLFRRGSARFTDDIVHERVICQPPYGSLDGLIIHDTIANEDEAIEKRHRYAKLSALALSAKGRGGLVPAFLSSAWSLLKGFVLKGGFLDGAVGWKVEWAIASGAWLRYRLAGRLRANGDESGVTQCGRPASAGWSDVGLTAATLAIVVLSLVLIGVLQILFEPEHLIFAFLIPIGLIAMRYGCVAGLFILLASDIAAAFFLYPPTFSLYIANRLHLAELLFFSILAFTANYFVVGLDGCVSVFRTICRLINYHD